MAEAKRDQNRVTGLLLEDDTTGLTVPALRDSSGRLKCIATIADNTSVQKVIVAIAGSTIGTRDKLNFIEGTHINYTFTDNAGADRVDMTIESTVFDATVGGTGDADYTTLKAAVDAGMARIMVMTSTTETDYIIINAVSLPNLFIYIKGGATVAMGVFDFEDTGALSVVVKGEGTISYAHTVANHELFDLSNTSSVAIDGVTITNTSTNSGCVIVKENTLQRITNLKINLPNVARGGIFFDGDAIRAHFLSDVEFVGGGTSCSEAFITTDSGGTAENIVLSGTFKASSSTAADAVINQVFLGSINNIVCNHLNADIRITVGDGGTISNVTAFDNDVDIYLNGNSSLSNAYLNTGDVVVGTSDFNRLANIETLGALNASNAGATNNEFVNCRFVAASNCVIAGDRNKFTNVEILGGASVPSGADNNGFVNCQFGVDAGGGALTLTVAAGANGTRIVGCMTDAAISDAGTGTVTAANVVY